MTIFLSAVTREFRDCRAALASDLRAIGCDVKVQEDFRQGGRSLLENLEDYIAGCDRVIALVGRAYGIEPHADSLASGAPRRSYTQWEYYFALGERLHRPKAPRKEILLYFPSTDYLAAHPVQQDDEAGGLQTDFVRFVCKRDEDRRSFSTCDQLCRQVLRDGWQMQERPHKPIQLPYASLGALFKGRQEFLAELHASLERTGQGRATAIMGKAVHGLGGVGKTRLAVEYAWQHAGDYSALLFVGAETPQDLDRNLAALAGPKVLNLAEQDLPEEEARAAAALRWLREHPKWLLILDNVDSDDAASAVEAMLGRLQGGDVLITGRLSQYSSSVEPLELDVLGEADSTAFLLERTERGRKKQPTDTAGATALAQELGGLAVALEQAAAHINFRRRSLADYLGDWRAHLPVVHAWYDPRLMNYPRSVAVTWQTTVEHLGAGATALLRLIAWMAPEPVPLFMFEGDSVQALWNEAVALAKMRTRMPAGHQSLLRTASWHWPTTAWSLGCPKQRRWLCTVWCRKFSAGGSRRRAVPSG
jgi:hypothetical protein